jgi:hypothetical protein
MIEKEIGPLWEKGDYGSYRPISLRKVLLFWWRRRCDRLWPNEHIHSMSEPNKIVDAASHSTTHFPSCRCGLCWDAESREPRAHKTNGPNREGDTNIR